MQTKVLAAGAASPLKLGSPRKRAPEENLKPLGTPALKKICVERDEVSTFPLPFFNACSFSMKEIDVGVSDVIEGKAPTACRGTQRRRCDI